MESTLEKLKKLIADNLGLDAEKVVPEAKIEADLGADSLDSVELVMAAEEEFDVEITDEDAQKVVTVQDLAELIERLQ